MLGEQKKRLDFAMHCRFVLHTHVCIPITSFARFAVHQETCRFLDHRFFGAVCTMTKRVNSSLVPKKGKARQVMKKPAMVKTKPWQDVPYTPQERFGRSTWSSYRSNQVEVYTLRPFESRQPGHRQAAGTGQTPHRHDRRHLSQMWKRHALQTHQVPRLSLETQVLITELPCVAQPTSLAPFVCGRMGQLG